MARAQGERDSGKIDGWSLCLATYRRLDNLETCVSCALDQTVPPREIIIADSGPDWEVNRDRISQIVGAANPDVRLSYLKSDVQGTCYQRNRAVLAATSDILFILDDDSFMDRDCAHQILSYFETDTEGKIAAIAIGNLPAHPQSAAATGLQKTGALGSSGDKRQRLKRMFPRWLEKFLYNKVFLLPMESRFIPYDGRLHIATTAQVDALGLRDVKPIGLLEGCRTTVRRDVAQKELFEENFLRYGPGGDVNCTYRYGRHGMLLKTTAARLYHLEAAPNRLKQKLHATLQFSNQAFGIKTRSSSMGRDVARYYVMVVRRAFALLLMDALSGRFAFFAVRGAAASLPISFALFFKRHDDVGAWYQAVQNRLFNK